ncbi:MAG: hypothetical protein R3304_00290 [Longimicrobiales bacterium]|nr:hypothetical protein [Longimicrobiales bacterium]
MTRLFAVLLSSALLAVTGTSAAGQEDVAGRWIFSIEPPDSVGVGMVQVPLVFEQEDTVVFGEVDLSSIPQIQLAEISEGRLRGGLLTFLLRVGSPQQWIIVEVEASVEGDRMRGAATIPMTDQVSRFTAQRVPSGSSLVPRPQVVFKAERKAWSRVAEEAPRFASDEVGEDDEETPVRGSAVASHQRVLSRARPRGPGPGGPDARGLPGFPRRFVGCP